jgi:hypothetical protein
VARLRAYRDQVARIEQQRHQAIRHMAQAEARQEMTEAEQPLALTERLARW